MSDTTTIEIFRVGTHTAMDGKVHTFTRDQLQAIADGYDAAVFQAPLVIGHPKHNDPALGWVQSLRLDGDVLLAEADQVEPAFAEAVNAGRWKKVSPWFYPPAGATNPKKGAHYLRHVGFLGAAAPGCQGLAPVAFAEGEDESELLAFGASNAALRPLVWMARSLGRVLRRQRDAIIADEGLEEADKVIPEWDIEAATDAANRLAAELDAGERPAFVEGEADPARDPEPTPDPDRLAAFAERQAELDAREQDLAAREAEIAAEQSRQAAAFAEADRQARAAEDAAWLEGLIDDGRLPPGYSTEVAAFCALLGDQEAIAFAEGEAAESPRDRFKALLDRLGVTIRFDEVAGGDGLRFAEPGADDFAAALDAEMSAAADAGTPIGSAEAARRVRARR